MGVTSYIEFGQNIDEFKQVTALFGGMFGSALKDNEALEKGMITGILRIAKASLFSDLNNVREYTLLDKYFTEFYGFTQEEVDELLSKVHTETDPNAIKDWYNGYTFGNEVIYNPWSIMVCLASEGALDHYWLDSGGTGLIDKILLSDVMQHELQELAAGKSIVSPITKQIIFSDIHKPVGLFSLLLFSGYLSPKPVEPEENIYELSVPNKEVKYIYENRVLQWVTDQLNSDSFGYYSFVSLLANGKVKEFEERLQELLHNATSFHQTGAKRAELFYNGFMLGMINMLAPSYIIESEREAGQGRPDIVLIPKVGKSTQGIIIEYKVTDNPESLVSVAQRGLQQINERGYDTRIKEQSHVQKIIKIAIAFCGKQVAMEYQIEQL